MSQDGLAPAEIAAKLSKMRRPLPSLSLSLLLLAPALGCQEQARSTTHRASQGAFFRESRAALALLLDGHGACRLDLKAWELSSAKGSPKLQLSFVRRGAEGFSIEARSPWLGLRFDRSQDRVRLLVPKAGKCIVSDASEASPSESLAPKGFLTRLLGKRLPILGAARLLLLGRLKALPASQDNENARILDADSTLTIERADLTKGGSMQLRARTTKAHGFLEGLHEVELRITQSVEPLEPAKDQSTSSVVPRAEFEKMYLRGLRRLLETQIPALKPTHALSPRKVPHGEVRIVQGQRLCLLRGNPEELGRAHGMLFPKLVRQSIDSYLYLVGSVETARTGIYFPKTMREAWQRLRPHVPRRHKQELRALADSVPGVSLAEVRAANMLPEYFHCSGFAAFGKATKTGELYHGRILDYMTLIGLQEAAVTFVVKPEGRLAFANVGYAGFIGSVTGMNEARISLGEMGGAGRYAWDGVPMAILMRRALEECQSLDAVKRLFKESPRTCEYYYVFADGKIPSAVGVKATPESIDFVGPGEAHPLLGKGIEDSVVLSAGNRLRLLRQRIQKAHGSIDAKEAIALMQRPVAMRSNLHSALMVPKTLELYVAHARGQTPAAEEPFVRFALAPLFQELAAPNEVPAKDSIAPDSIGPKRTRKAVEALLYTPSNFRVQIEPFAGEADALVRFPSPKPLGIPENDIVPLEWYKARGRGLRGSEAAMLVLHILDGRMLVARSVARYLSRSGIHAFVMHLPGYGLRRSSALSRDAKTLAKLLRQGAADARRAEDAIAALPGIDGKRIGIQGTSLGSFVAALASAIDGNFRWTFLMLSGADLPSMFAKGEKDTAKLRRALEKAGARGKELEATLRSIDPLYSAPRLRPARTWLYSATADRVVPARNAKILGKAAGLDAKHHIWFPGNHYTGIVFLPQIFREMKERILR